MIYKVGLIMLLGMVILLCGTAAVKASTLWEAAGDGNIAEVQQLLQKATPVNIKDDEGWTALHWAVKSGRVDMVQFLLEKGASVSEKDKNGWSPLHIASLLGHTSIAEMLLNKHADIEDKSNSGWTPLYAATYMKHPETSKLLIAKGANSTAISNDGMPPASAEARSEGDTKSDLHKTVSAIVGVVRIGDSLKGSFERTTDILATEHVEEISARTVYQQQTLKLESIKNLLVVIIDQNDKIIRLLQQQGGNTSSEDNKTKAK